MFYMNQTIISDTHRELEKIDIYARIVQDSSAIGCLLNGLVKDTNSDDDKAPSVEEILQDYIHDFIHTNYNPCSDEELQVLS